MLRRVRLLTVLCAPGDGDPDRPPPGSLNVSGTLKSNDENGFLATVSWSLRFPERADSPITISGKHQLDFTVTRPIAEDDAKYYAEINAVILVYPYLRQLIDDLSTKSLGRSIMIPPLDVPRFAEDRRNEKQESEPRNDLATGADLDAQEVTR